MIRRPLLSALLVCAALLPTTACNKPSAEDCRAALTNMQRLLGTDQLFKEGDIEGEIRRCRGGSKRESVACAIKATTLDELRACNFNKLPAGAGAAGSGGAGSGSGGAGSGSGSAGSGS
jgi:hypothetical protein